MLSKQLLVFLFGCYNSIQFLIPVFPCHAVQRHFLLFCEPFPGLPLPSLTHFILSLQLIVEQFVTLSFFTLTLSLF